MKKLNKVALALATLTVAGSAVAAGDIDNWRNVDNELVWKNGTNELCWRDAFWTPATAALNCDGALAPAVAPEAAPAPARVVPEPHAPQPPVAAEKITYSAEALFDFDKSVLKPQGRQILDELVSKVQGINLEVMVAIGHTDSIGSDAYNQRLSMRRAEAVKAYLVSKGIEQDRVATEGKGEKQPVASNKTREGRAQNRRVEIEVVGTRAVPAGQGGHSHSH